MGHGGYWFAEGAEPLRYFWKPRGHWFCRHFTWDETTAFWPPPASPNQTEGLSHRQLTEIPA